jgi:hypothetical protein
VPLDTHNTVLRQRPDCPRHGVAAQFQLGRDGLLGHAPPAVPVGVVLQAHPHQPLGQIRPVAPHRVQNAKNAH